MHLSSPAHPRRIRRGAAGIVLFAAMATMAVVPTTAGARPAPASAPSAPSVTPAHLPGSITYLRAKHTPAGGFVAPRALPSTRVSSVHSSFVVTYVGFPTAAKAAFQRAVDLWSTMVSSTQPIRVKATWTALDPGILGGAGPSDLIRDFAGAPKSATWYPVALANALAKQDLSTQPDIEAEFTSATSEWYFGTDGNTPGNKLDFTTVVLHELGHGLGLVDSSEINGSQGRWGLGTPYPFVYDRFVQNAAGTPVTSITNPSTTLGSIYQSNAARWGGAQAIAGAGGSRPYLYSPNPYQAGSSISHLDESVYPTATANALMTPYLDDGEAIHDPGDIGLGMMRDMGWTTVGGKGVPAAATVTAALGGSEKVSLSWKPSIDTGRQFLTAMRLSRYEGGSSSASVVTDYPASSAGTIVTGLTNGTQYRFAVAAVNATGAGAQSAKTETIVPLDLTPFTYTSHLVRQQFTDFLGRAATSAEVSTWDSYLHAGALTPGSVVSSIAALPDSATARARMTRLYSAYFARLPDFSGFTYWTGKLAAGTSLKKASDTFAASSEFKTKYGSLSNKAFVQLVYVNVLHRDADPAGLDHWLAKLDTHALSRGSVMLSFSESSENTRHMASEVTSVLLRSGMLRRMPTKTEYDADVAALDGGATAADLATATLALPAYATRITP